MSNEKKKTESQIPPTELSAEDVSSGDVNAEDMTIDEFDAKLDHLTAVSKAQGLGENEIHLEHLMSVSLYNNQKITFAMANIGIAVGMDLYEKYAIEAGFLTTEQIPLLRAFIQQASSRDTDARAAAFERENVTSMEFSVPSSGVDPGTGSIN